jgi:hypothetical protein
MSVSGRECGCQAVAHSNITVACTHFGPARVVWRHRARLQCCWPSLNSRRASLRVMEIADGAAQRPHWLLQPLATTSPRLYI